MFTCNDDKTMYCVCRASWLLAASFLPSPPPQPWLWAWSVWNYTRYILHIECNITLLDTIIIVCWFATAIGLSILCVYITFKIKTPIFNKWYLQIAKVKIISYLNISLMFSYRLYKVTKTWNCSRMASAIWRCHSSPSLNLSRPLRTR